MHMNICISICSLKHMKIEQNQFEYSKIDRMSNQQVISEARVLCKETGQISKNKRSKENIHVDRCPLEHYPPQRPTEP